jgi:hypothetical protein
VLAAGAAFSSLLVLRQAPVAPDDHRDQLAELRPLVEGEKVLFLGRDNFVLHELRGSRPVVAVRNFYDPYYVKPNLRLERVFSKFDFDSVRPSTLARFHHVITTRAGYASGPPPAYRPLALTDDYVLWERRGPLGERRTLAEGDRPGAVLRCGDGRQPTMGGATIFEPAPVGPATSWEPGTTIENGGSASQTLRLGPGRWALSLQYDSTRPLTVRAAGLEARLPANLDYRGSAPFWPAGEVSVPPGDPVTITATVDEPPAVGRILGADSVAHLGAFAATRLADGGPLPGKAGLAVGGERACGSYVDWYRPRS